MSDYFEFSQPGLSSPFSGGFAVSPSDEDAMAFTSRYLYVGTAGDVSVTMVNGDGLTFSSVPAGSWMPVRVNQVWDTNTTADEIIALF